MSSDNPVAPRNKIDDITAEVTEPPQEIAKDVATGEQVSAAEIEPEIEYGIGHTDVDNVEACIIKCHSCHGIAPASSHPLHQHLCRGLIL